MYYCGCNVVLHSVVAISDEDEVPLISDSSSWASLYRPVEPAIVDPNQAPTEVAPSFLRAATEAFLPLSPIRESVRLSRGFQQPFSAPFQESSPCLFSGTRYLPRPIRESARPVRGLRGPFF